MTGSHDRYFFARAWASRTLEVYPKPEKNQQLNADLKDFVRDYKKIASSTKESNANGKKRRSQNANGRKRRSQERKNVIGFPDEQRECHKHSKEEGWTNSCKKQSALLDTQFPYTLKQNLRQTGNDESIVTEWKKGAPWDDAFKYAVGFMNESGGVLAFGIHEYTDKDVRRLGDKLEENDQREVVEGFVYY